MARPAGGLDLQIRLIRGRMQSGLHGSANQSFIPRTPLVAWFPVPNTKQLYNICTTAAQRLRRWSNVVQMLYKCFVFAGYLCWGCATGSYPLWGSLGGVVRLINAIRRDGTHPSPSLCGWGGGGVEGWKPSYKIESFATQTQCWANAADDGPSSS